MVVTLSRNADKMADIKQSAAIITLKKIIIQILNFFVIFRLKNIPTIHDFLHNKKFELISNQKSQSHKK